MIQVVINVQLHENRVAIIEDNKLVELFIERSDQRRIVSNIYKGVVENIVPGLQAAFIELGLPKRAFLHASDIYTYSALKAADAETREIVKQPMRQQDDLPIQHVLRKGQELIVQVYREPIGTKGPRCSTQLSIAGRYLVLIPGARHIGISRRVVDRTERIRLRKAMTAIKPTGFGVIIRTISKGLSAESLKLDLDQLLKVWNGIINRIKALPPGSLIYRDTGLIPTLVRDQLSPDVEYLTIDSHDEYNKMIRYINTVAPEMKEKIKLYNQPEPIFDYYGIEKQITDMMRREVRLHSGGEIVIDQTEALTAIDVNSSRFTGKRKYQNTIFKVNLEAAEEIARQLRLRDIGGLIAIDFIDMEDQDNIKKVEKTFKTAIKTDRARRRILPINEFGMLILTRERIEQSVLTQITEMCPTCRGIGRIYSPSTMVANIERWLVKAKGKYKDNVLLLIHPQVAEELLSDNGQRIKDFKDEYGINLTVFADDSLSPYKFRIIETEMSNEKKKSQNLLNI